MKKAMLVLAALLVGCGAEPWGSTVEPVDEADAGDDAPSTVNVVVRCQELDGAPAPCFGDGG